jgi:hypothetical protein
MPVEHGDYIFYADESGDHSLTSIDAGFPVFALSLCAFKKQTYCRRIIPDFLRFKFKYFGHDSVVLHEREVRKQTGPFVILSDMALRQRFLDELGDLIAGCPFHIFPVVIAKQSLRLDFFPDNPYVIALRIALQSASLFLQQRGQTGRVHHFIFEKRGAKEDAELELEFRRIVDGANDLGHRLEGFHIHFSDKRTNSTGMQIADLTARPLALRISRPNQPNRAFETFQHKLFKKRKFAKPTRGIHIP